MNKLIFNYIQDMKKQQLDNFERAAAIRVYLDSEKISIRELARRTGLKRSTIEDWLRWERITPEKLEELKERGYNETDVYRFLRTRVDVDKIGKNDSIQKPIDFVLDRAYSSIRPFKLDAPYSEDTLKLVERLIVLLHKIKSNIKDKTQVEDDEDGN